VVASTPNPDLVAVVLGTSIGFYPEPDYPDLRDLIRIIV
jgi:hypothetical protein